METSSEKPLAGKRIVITRVREQAASLAEPLEGMGAEILYFPAISFRPPNNAAELDNAIGELSRFDWLVLTSQNAVRFFCKRCRELGTSPAHLKMQVAAVGPATAEAARAEGLAVNFVARRHSGAALAEEFGNGVRGKRILLPRSDRAGEELPAKLRATGAEVVEVVAYCTMTPVSADAHLSDAIRKGAADVIVFASPSAVYHFAEQAGWNSMMDVTSETVLAAIGPTTAKALRELGVSVEIEAAESTAAGLAAAIEEYFRLKSSAEVRGQ